MPGDALLGLGIVQWGRWHEPYLLPGLSSRKCALGFQKPQLVPKTDAMDGVINYWSVIACLSIILGYW
jgi:hypothetical protein